MFICFGACNSKLYIVVFKIYTSTLHRAGIVFVGPLLNTNDSQPHIFSVAIQVEGFPRFVVAGTSADSLVLPPSQEAIVAKVEFGILGGGLDPTECYGDIVKNFVTLKSNINMEGSFVDEKHAFGLFATNRWANATWLTVYHGKSDLLRVLAFNKVLSPSEVFNSTPC